jgi:hypothetical protein
VSRCCSWAGRAANDRARGQAYSFTAASIAKALVDDLKAKQAELAMRRASAEQALARLDVQHRALEQVILETASLLDYCKRMHGRLQTDSVEEQRLALEALDIHVVWHPERPLEITGAIPAEIPDTAHAVDYHALGGAFEQKK